MPDHSEEERAAALAEKVAQEASAVTERVEARAEKLEEQRAGQAEALEEQRAGQASALEEQRASQASALEEQRSDHAMALADLQAEQRIEQRIIERIEQRADIKAELRDVAVSIGQLVAHMDQSMPEERMQAMVDAVVSEEHAARKRLTVTIVGALLIIIGLAASSLVQSHSNGKTLNEARTVSTYVKNCLVAPAPHDPIKCGPDNTARFVQSLLTSINCSLLISPEARTEENTHACAVKTAGP